MRRRLIYTTDLAVRDKHAPALHRSVFFGEIEHADSIMTDMPEVRDAYKKAGIEVKWVGKRKKKVVKKHGGQLRDDS